MLVGWYAVTMRRQLYFGAGIGFAIGFVVAMTLAWLNLDNTPQRLTFIGAGLVSAWAGSQCWKLASKV